MTTATVTWRLSFIVVVARPVSENNLQIAFPLLRQSMCEHAISYFAIIIRRSFSSAIININRSKDNRKALALAVHSPTWRS